jgi:uncharacterized protein YraI
MKPFHAKLWLIGAATYGFATLIFLYVVFFAGDESNVAGSYYQSQVATVGTQGKPSAPTRQAKPASDSALAAQLGSSEPSPPNSMSVPPPVAQPNITQLPVNVPGTAVVATAAPATVSDWKAQTAAKETTDDASKEHEGTSKVITSVSIRSGPSTSSPVVGTASAGSRVLVSAARSGWARITEPTSGREGWVYSRFLSTQFDEGEVSISQVKRPNSHARTVEPEDRQSPIAEAKPKERRTAPLPTQRGWNSEIDRRNEDLVLLEPQRRGLLQRFRERRGPVVVESPH